MERFNNWESDVIDYDIQVYSVFKIEKYFLDAYYSPYTAMGKRRFNRELDKLE